MSESRDEQPTGLLRTRRLEIVDEEGKVRAVLGTNEEGVTSLSVFDQSARLRASLDASGVPEQMNGLGVFDTYKSFRIPLTCHHYWRTTSPSSERALKARAKELGVSESKLVRRMLESLLLGGPVGSGLFGA